jgi:hypothetical protein
MGRWTRLLRLFGRLSRELEVIEVTNRLVQTELPGLGILLEQWAVTAERKKL